MIHSFRVKNFYSIKDKVEVDFVAKNKGITMPELYLEAPLGKKVTRVAFVGGANGSGKTNILRVLAFLRFMMNQAGTATPGVIPYYPFCLSEDEKSEIEVVFSANERTYNYKLIFDKAMIFEESLFVTSMVAERATRKKVYSRFWSNGTYVVEVSDLAKSLRSVKAMGAVLAVDSNKTKTIIDLYTGIDEVGGLLREVKMFWMNLFTNIVSFGNIESEFSTSQLANDALKEAESGFGGKTIMERILKSADIGYAGMAKFKAVGNDNNFLLYGIQHNYNDKVFRFPVLEESTGTNRIIYLAKEIAKVLSRNEGGVAVIDDMDAYIHPEIYTMLVEQFMSPSVDKNGTQLILSSHNYTTLNFLDKQQIILTERNKEGATESWRLDQMKDVVSHDNFYAKYMAGKYGAVPRAGEV